MTIYNTRYETFTYRYCWEITRTNNVQYAEQSRSWGNFTELQTLSSNNSNCAKMSDKRHGTIIRSFSNSNILGCDERIEPLIEHHLALNISCVFYVYVDWKNISHCLPSSISCFYFLFFFFFKNGNDSVSLSIRNIIFFKAFVEGFYIRMQEISILLRGIDSWFD